MHSRVDGQLLVKHVSPKMLLVAGMVVARNPATTFAVLNIKVVRRVLSAHFKWLALLLLHAMPCCLLTLLTALHVQLASSVVGDVCGSHLCA
jgi:hypothetical protein